MPLAWRPSGNPAACIGDVLMKPRHSGSSSASAKFTSWRVFGVLGLVLAGTFIQPVDASAKIVTLIVSKGVNCWPQVAGPLYPTIQSAITAIPIAPNAVNTIIVCPGVYPEQVVITKNVTITGALRDGTDPASENGNSAEAKIVVPDGGLVARAFGTGYIAAQVVAQNIVDVNLINLTIDGHNGGCPVDPTAGQPVRSAGVAFYNVGVTGTGNEGNVSKSAIRAQVGLKADGSRCYPNDGQGEGIIVDGVSSVTIDSNSIHDIDLSPIRQTGGITRITNNTLNRTWYGIWLTGVGAMDANRTGSTVSFNYVESTTGAGVHLEGSSNVLVSENNITNSFGSGIWVSHGSSANDVVENRINDAWYGIYLGGNGSGGQTGNNVTYNTIVHCVNVAIVDAFSHGGNNVTLNTINDAPLGLFYLSTGDDVFLPNTFFATTMLTATGTSAP